MSDYAFPPKGEFEYRPMVRSRKVDEEQWTPWSRLGNRLSYGSIGAARVIIGRDRNDYNKMNARWGKRQEREWRVERRPVDQWEVCEDD